MCRWLSSLTAMRIHSAPSIERVPLREADPGLTQPLEELPAAINFRDVAELDPLRLKTGVAFRSSELFKYELLGQHRIKTLLDLRKQMEPETHPVYVQLSHCDKSTDLDNVVCVCQRDLIQPAVKMSILSKMPRRIWWQLMKCCMSGGKPEHVMCTAVADPKSLGFLEFYKILVDKAGDVVADILRIFADASNLPVLFHCTHGKDRTGVLCCLLGLIAGVTPEVICQDYVLSGSQLQAAKSMYKLPIPDHLMVDSVIDAPYEVIEGLIEYIETKYGGVEGYSKSIGLTDHEIKAIRSNLQRPS